MASILTTSKWNPLQQLPGTSNEDPTVVFSSSEFLAAHPGYLLSIDRSESGGRGNLQERVEALLKDLEDRKKLQKSSRVGRRRKLGKRIDTGGKEFRQGSPKTLQAWGSQSSHRERIGWKASTPSEEPPCVRDRLARPQSAQTLTASEKNLWQHLAEDPGRPPST